MLSGVFLGVAEETKVREDIWQTRGRAKRGQRVFTEGSLAVARLYSDLIDDERRGSKERKERLYIHDRPSLGPAIFNPNPEPVKSTPPGRAS
jgi:hypothetical protein